MNVSVITRICVAIVVGTALIVFDAMWDDIFFADFQYSELIEHRSESGEITGYGIAHFMRTPSILEAIARVAIPLLALAGAAAYVTKLTRTPRIWAGSLASVSVGLIALLVIHNVYAPQWGKGYIPHPLNLAGWGLVSFVVGAVASWVAVRWPNKSLERTRAG